MGARGLEPPNLTDVNRALWVQKQNRLKCEHLGEGGTQTLAEIIILEIWLVD